MTDTERSARLREIREHQKTAAEMLARDDLSSWNGELICDDILYLLSIADQVERLQTQIDMAQEPCVIDEARWLDERNSGAISFAQSVLNDPGGTLSPGPCAEVVNEWRRMKAEVERLQERCEVQDELIYELAHYARDEVTTESCAAAERIEKLRAEVAALEGETGC